MGRGGHEGLVRGYQDGGRVGLLARALQGRWMDRLGQVLAERPIGVQAPADAADRILDEGRFRTQFETGRSGGSMHGRAELEQHLWGLPPDLPAQQRPVYGALRSANVEEVPRRLPEWQRGQAWQGLGHYGGHLFLLRPEAKARSTLTFDDSFALHPHAVSPSWEGGLGRPFRFGEIPPADAMARALAGRRPMLAESMGPGPGHRDIDFELNSLGSPYIETQTPGPVAMDEVEALLVPESVSSRVRGMARDRGIPVYDHEEVAHDRDLQRQLRLRVLPAAGGAGAAFEGLVGGREDGARYQDGGRVGLLARGLGAVGDTLARALREGVARRTPQNPRGLPMDADARRARAEAMGFDVDRRYLHATHSDFSGFDPARAGSGANAAMEGERAVFLTDAPAVADSYLAGYHVRREAFPDAVPISDDVGRLYAPEARVLPVVLRGRDDMVEWDMDGARYDPSLVARVFRDARSEDAPGAIMEQFRDPGMMVAGPLGSGAQRSEVVAVFDPARLRSPHATFDPMRGGEADLLAGVGGGLAGAAGAGAAFEGRDGGARYAAGGLANAPGPEDDIAATQGAASRGLAQAQQMWLAAGRVLGA